MRKTDVRRRKNLSGSMISKIFSSIRRLNIYILVIGPIIISLLVLGLLFFAGKRIYGDNVPEIYQAVSGVIFLVVLSFSGAVQFFRREGIGPLGYPISGIWPMITGCVIMIICWASIIYLLFYVFTLMRI